MAFANKAVKDMNKWELGSTFQRSSIRAMFFSCKFKTERQFDRTGVFATAVFHKLGGGDKARELENLRGVYKNWGYFEDQPVKAVITKETDHGDWIEFELGLVDATDPR